LDVANMMAHLRWMSAFGGQPRCAAYREDLMLAARALPAFDDEGLRLREAYALYRVCTNAISQAFADWPDKLRTGLQLCADALEGAECAVGVKAA
jgi:hypothetical protein